MLAFGIGVMINRDSRGHSYFIVRGEILGFMKDEQLRKHMILPFPTARITVHVFSQAGRPVHCSSFSGLRAIPTASAVHWPRFLEGSVASSPLKSSPKRFGWRGLNREISSFVARVLVRTPASLPELRADPSASHWPHPLEVSLAPTPLGL